MRYSIYNYCNESEFDNLKKMLNSIKDKVVDSFPDKFEVKHRHDDSDALNLNFKLINAEPYKGNFAIIFEDLPEDKTFAIVILKTLDLEGYRYGEKKIVRENIGIDEISSEIIFIAEEALEIYESLTYEDVINSDKTKLGN